MNINTEEVRKILKWGWFVLIALVIFLAAETLGALKNLRSIEPTFNSISITGEGEAISIPDVSVFSFTVSADDKVSSDAQEQVTKKMDNILAKLKALGIEEKDINTTDYSLRPKYVSGPTICSPTFCPPSRLVQDGYTVGHNVSIKVRSTENVGEALAVAAENGATDISNITFTVDDPDKMLNEARTEAIQDAREKAKLLAKALGIKLVRIVSFYDNTGGGPIPYATEAMGGDTMKATSVPAPTIPIGENKVKVSVTIVYEIR